jgi:hypothetical protein
MDFTTFRKIFFKDKHHYRYVTEKEKAASFFILNRLMARMKPTNADALNHKGMNTALATDLWFKFCEQSLDVPEWFKAMPFKTKTDVFKTNNEELDDMDKLILQKFFENEIKEEKTREQLANKKVETIIVKKLKKKKGN